MDELIAATGGPQYNVLRRLTAHGYRITKTKEGGITRYSATAPARAAYELAVSEKGQVTLPKELRERLGVGRGGLLRAVVENERLIVARKGGGIEDLFGILPRPARPRTLAEIERGIEEGAADVVRRKRA